MSEIHQKGKQTKTKENSDIFNERGSVQRNYLIKRSNSIRELKKINSKKKGYFEIIITKVNRTPPSNKLRNGDLIFVAETRGGIYAKGKVIESFPVKEFETVEEVLNFSKQFKDDSYWLNKIRSFQEKLLITKAINLSFMSILLVRNYFPKQYHTMVH